MTSIYICLSGEKSLISIFAAANQTTYYRSTLTITSVIQNPNPNGGKLVAISRNNNVDL
ncbi:MAG TPA: hypothetical protein PLP06_02540 [Saprospiraceae bacterium]|nr:hypothetical protein [Saprospiraceae bacterium]